MHRSPFSSILALVALTTVVLSSPRLAAAELLAGPMVGHTTPTSTRIWVETTESAGVHIDYWQSPRLQYDNALREPIRRGSSTGRTAPDYPHTGVIALEDLQPGWTLHYTVQIDGQRVRALSPQIVSLMPGEAFLPGDEGEPPEFAVAFGSCNFPARVPIQPIWSQVLRRRPAAFIFLGDNNYLPDPVEAFAIAPADLTEVYADTHRTFKNTGGLRELFASTPSYAIWDDHDFGPGNSDRTFPARAVSLEMFNRYWANPAAGTPETPGVFHAFQIADVEFFLLDNRYHRDPNESPDRKTMLGSAQFAWLKQAIKASSATFKVVGHGGTTLAHSHGETWAGFGTERDDLLAWISREAIEGVFFIAGDWHVGALHRLNRPQDAYPFYELLSSNLAVRMVSDEPYNDWKKPEPDEWAAPYYPGYNFGMLRFAGPTGDRTATLHVLDEFGKIRIELILSQNDLRMEKRTEH